MGHVIDQTGTLTAIQKTTLEQMLTAFEARKGSQLAVLMVASTAPEAIEQYALRVAERWKLGRKKVDDGAILVVAKNDRMLRIEVGYGLEGALNDATSKRIISETIVPQFKQQDFYGGITAGVGQIIRVVDGEPLSVPGKTPIGELGGGWQHSAVRPISLYSRARGGWRTARHFRQSARLIGHSGRSGLGCMAHRRHPVNGIVRWRAGVVLHPAGRWHGRAWNGRQLRRNGKRWSGWPTRRGS